MDRLGEFELLGKLASDGCLDEKQKHLTVMVYSHLKDVCEWIGLEMKYSSKLKQIYLTGNDGKSANLTTVVAIDSAEMRSLASLHDLLFLQENHCVVVAICSADGTVVCYELGDVLDLNAPMST